MSKYNNDLIDRFWKYQKMRFPDLDKYFDRTGRTVQRPPVFIKKAAKYNVLMEPGIDDDKQKKILEEIPVNRRHRWFCSMKSSQALALTVFGNLKTFDRIGILSELQNEGGEFPFENAVVKNGSLCMEHDIDYLGEPRRTNVDVFVSGNYQIGVECKLTENDFGTCSRSRLKPEEPNYNADFCDGTYTYQRGRKERCSLTEIGILYWKYIPNILYWRNDIDLTPCPLNLTYQLVRNILAVCVRPDGTVAPERGHVVLIYDERNHAFHNGGKAHAALKEISKVLRFPNLLRMCTWQKITERIRHEPVLQWLGNELKLKYGF
jgi:hypothetical protein